MSTMKKLILLLIVVVASAEILNAATYTTIVSPSGSGTITRSGAKCTATPKTGYKFVSWKVDYNSPWFGKFTKTSTKNPVDVGDLGGYGYIDASITITAYFETAATFTITWTNWDGTTLAATSVVQGATPSYTGSTPTRPSTAEYAYTFSGWTPAITAATADKTYTATYTQTLRKYNITFVNADGVQIGSVQQIEYGQNATPPTPPTRDGYTFSGWVGRYVHVQYDATIYASYKIRNEVLPGLFSISNTEKVYFSQGNLQYYAASGTHSCADDTNQPGTWRFAEHQYDYVGNGNAEISSSYVGWIDLFGWGTSGWNSGASAYQPYSTSEINSDYYPGNSPSNDLIGAYQYADWGIYNAIYNGGNLPKQWRTLTGEQIGYLYSGRENAATKRSPATINSITGYIFLPDNWVLPSGVTFTADASDYTSNDYSLAEWNLMEKHGAVFLPSAGYRRNGVVPTSYLIMGDYWTSTTYDADNANRLMTRTDFVRAGVDSKEERHYGFSVRLVKDVNVYTITFNATGGIIPADGNMGNTPINHVTTLSTDRTIGSVMVVAGFSYFNSMSGDCPSREGYIFEGWYTDPINGVQVYDASGQSIEGAYWNSPKQWIGTSDVTLYAHWTPLTYTISTSADNGSVTGGGTYDYDTSHQLTATPNECYQFSKWSDDNTDNPRTITVTGDATYTAEFEQIQYTIEALPDNPAQGSATVTNP